MFEEVGDYSLEDRLGQGTSGQVFKGPFLFENKT